MKLKLFFSIELIIILFSTIVSTKLSKSDDLIIAKQDIIHATSGLILQYKSNYRPANQVVSLTTIIPIVADMCYLIPIYALRKIPRCNLTNDFVNFIDRDPKYIPNKYSGLKRNKRFITDIISIGVGTAALSMSTVNTVQITSLKTEMKEVEESLKIYQKTELSRRAQILQLTEGQLKLAIELNSTQQALYRTMELVNQHSGRLREHDEAIKRVGKFSVFVNDKLNAFIHSVEGRFLHDSIEDILQNKLNLDFIHHDDIPNVIKLVIKATNVTFDEEGSSSFSMLDLITRLLVQQEIHFVASKHLKVSNNGAIIGKLSFTSFFAASAHNQEPFFCL